LSSREPGTVLDGKYEIVERLASGGMGEVYLVRHVHLQELRVVKILRQDLAADPVAQKRFVREARLATQIKHSNVAILYDFSRLPDGSFYMVWEHIEGRDVGEVLRQRGPFPVATALRLGIQALRGLGAIHSAGIIHRDVSPDNLMIVENQRQQAWVKIIDLGLAKNLAPEDATSSGSFEITQVGMFMGKLQYCSPEQAGAASGEVLDRRTDLYSFALVLYEMVTGLPPFESESPHGFIFKRLSEEPLPMAGRNPKVQVPAELDRAIRQALERDRDRRFPDAVSFIVALEKVEKGLSRVETKEVVMPAESRATTSAAAAPPPPRQRSSSELSREERLDLLAQIERAARRVSESSLDLARVEGVIAAGRIEEGRRLLAQIEAANPRTPGLERIKERLAQAQGQGPAPAPAKTPEPAPAQTSAPAGPREVAAVPRPAGAGPPPSAPPGATPPAGSPGSGISRPMARSGATPAVAAAAAAAALAGAPAPAPAAAPTPAPAAALRAAAPAIPPAATAMPPAATAMPPAAAPPAGPDARTADQRQRTGEAEKALRRYLERKQLALARLALETLLELAPQHPNRTDYESWVNLLAEEVEQDRRAEVALQAARAAILRRDFAKAHQELEQVRRNDLSGERAEALERELQDVEQGLRQGAEFERHRQRLDELLGARKLAEAEREIEQLAGLGLSNITLGSYRERLEEARLAAEQERLAAPIEKRYRELLHARDWFGARDAALELERAAPASPRPAAMHAEIERLESIHRHQQAVEQGVRQVEAFVEKGDLANAELALRILLQIDPENRHRKRFERQLRSGRG
jgi:serine/threonine protein kinase